MLSRIVAGRELALAMLCPMRSGEIMNDQSNHLYFTRATKRYERIGDTLVIVTEGATITITLNATAGTPATVKVSKPAARKPATPDARKPATCPPATRTSAGTGRVASAERLAAKAAAAAATPAKVTAGANRKRRTEVLARVAARNTAG
jgi:hypothetical protein